MRIAFDMLIAEQMQSGVHQATLGLLDNLAMLDSAHHYIVITGRPGDYRGQELAANIHLHTVKMNARQDILIQRQLLLPRILQRLHPDILHVPNAIAPIGWHGPLVITIHEPMDLDEPRLAPQTAQACISPALLYRQHLLSESMQRAQAIIITAEQPGRIHTIPATPDFGKQKCIYILDENSQAHVVLHAYNDALSHAPDQTPKQDTTKCNGMDEVRTNVQAKKVMGVPGTVSFAADSDQQNKTLYPSVSIVIPATRLEQAEQALIALSQQVYAGPLETIVVGLPGPVLAARWPISAVHSETTHKPGRARNLGAAQANGAILLFLDDDMLVAPDWVEQNVRALDQEGAGVVGARMPGRTQTFYARCADFTNYGHYQHKRAMQEVLGAGSMGIRKALFTEVGGFNEELSAGEDVELCYRIQARGYRTLYQPQIVVLHDHHYDNLYKLLHYNYTHGFQGGSVVRMRPRSQRLHSCLIAMSTQYPLLFLPLLPMLALLGTIKIVCLNRSLQLHVLLYAPYIFLGKVAYQYGVFVYLLRGRKIC
ncbi:MAG: hypothetical protein NVS2B12_15470 [Ktedonobacteraceae bacterium]